MELELATFSVANVLRASVNILKEKAMKHNLKLNIDIQSGEDIEIEADERKLKQIMFNLLSNAVKFTPDEGSVCVAARLISGLPLPDTDYIEISVADTGIGIKAEDMTKLFKEFTQLESVYTRHYPGTGLGLAVSRRLVELHGGKIWVESEPEKGSKFTFAIPVKQTKIRLPRAD
jgi:signal transduction histidine kinase